MVATDETDEEKINAVCDKCKDAVVNIVLEKDFKGAQSKQLAVSLGMYAIGKLLAEEKKKDEKLKT